MFGTRLISTADHITEENIARAVLLPQPQERRLFPGCCGHDGEKEKGVGEELSPSPPHSSSSLYFQHFNGTQLI